jgi:hypothetical protein
MHLIKRLIIALGVVGFLALNGVTSAAASEHSVKLSGTRFEMDVPSGWEPGYKDLDDKMLMIYFKSPKTGVTLEGIYLRKVQPATFTLEDFQKWRIDAENKRYEGKDHKILKTDSLTIGGEKGNYLLSSWNDGGKEFVKHTAQFLKDGKQYMVVLHGPKGKVDKKIFDHAVATFALSKE